jgi:hypothetical protein
MTGTELVMLAMGAVMTGMSPIMLGISRIMTATTF